MVVFFSKKKYFEKKSVDDQKACKVTQHAELIYISDHFIQKICLGFYLPAVVMEAVFQGLGDTLSMSLSFLLSSMTSESPENIKYMYNIIANSTHCIHVNV